MEVPAAGVRWASERRVRDKLRESMAGQPWTPWKDLGFMWSDMGAAAVLSQRIPFDSYDKRITLSDGLIKDCQGASWQVEDLARDHSEPRLRKWQWRRWSEWVYCENWAGWGSWLDGEYEKNRGLNDEQSEEKNRHEFGWARLLLEKVRTFVLDVPSSLYYTVCHIFLSCWIFLFEEVSLQYLLI